MENIGQTHIAILGRNPLLSLAELESVFGKKNVSAIQLKEQPLQFAKINHPTPKKFMSRLGGTIKISAVQEIPKNKESVAELIAEIVAKMLSDTFFSQDHKKLIYGINVYPIHRKNDVFLSKLFKKIKPLLKSQKIPSRYLNKKNENLHTALIIAEKLVKKETDINVFLLENRIWLGRSVAIQNINNYTARDFARPARDDKSGMLPPKLAQTLINLAMPFLQDSNKLQNTIYDPFCGSGTILQEAILMGYKALGSDISPKAISDSKTNLDWLEQKLTPSETPINFHVIQADASKLTDTNRNLYKKASAVVFEGYLGPALSIQPTIDQIRNVHNELLPLYKSTLLNIAENVKGGTPVIMALPIHYYRRKPVPLPKMAQIIQEAGFEHKNAQTLIYKRPQQLVGREIWVLRKK